MGCLALERNALVWGICGNLGGGKSLSATFFMVNAMRSGFFVCSNMQLNVAAIERDFGVRVSSLYMFFSLDESFDPSSLPCGDPRGSLVKRRVLVVIDECAEWFDQFSNTKNPAISRFLSWLRHSSKRSQDVFLVVQRPEYLNKSLRILIARWILVDDLAVYRLPIIKMRLPFCSGLVCAKPFDRNFNAVGGVSFIRKAKWGRYYYTAQCLNERLSSSVFVYLPPLPRRVCTRFWILFLVGFLFFAASFIRRPSVRASVPLDGVSTLVGNTIMRTR